MVRRLRAGVGGLERGGRTVCSSRQGLCTHQGLGGVLHSFRPSVLGHRFPAKGLALEDRGRGGIVSLPTEATAERRTERVRVQPPQRQSRPRFPIEG